MQRKIDNTIEYEAKELLPSQYAMHRVIAVQGTQSLTVAENSPTVLNFELDVEMVNLARTRIRGDASIPAQGAGNYIWRHLGNTPFVAVQFNTMANLYLLQINADNGIRSRVLRPLEKQGDQLLHGSALEDFYPAHAALAFLGGEGATGAVGAPYMEQKYLAVGAANTAMTYSFDIPLGEIVQSIMAVDKTVPFGEKMKIQLSFAKGTDIAYYGTSNTNPDTGAATIVGNITYSNLALYVAEEQNPAVVKDLRDEVNSEDGFSMLFPYPTIVNNTRTGTSQNVTLNLDRYNGVSLKSITHCVTPAAATAVNNLRYDHKNSAGSKIVSYQSFINSRPLTEYLLTNSDHLDWMHNSKKLKDSAIWNQVVYDTNWAHQDDFQDYADKRSDLKTVDTNVFSGMSLDNTVRYDFYSTTAGNDLIHYDFINCQKVLNINRNGILVK